VDFYPWSFLLWKDFLFMKNFIQNNKSRTFCSQRSFKLSHCSPEGLTQPQQAAGSSKKVRDKKLLLIFLLFFVLFITSGLYLKKPEAKPTALNQVAPQNSSIGFSPSSEFPSASPDMAVKQTPSPSGASPNQPVFSPAPSSVQSLKETPSGEAHVLLAGDRKYEIAVPENSTVFDLMSALKQRGDFDFKGKNSTGLGFFVEEINGLKNNPSDNTYWIYYVNGKAANVGISNYILKPNDVITWKYEKL